jgi:hypothetical protein
MLKNAAKFFVFISMFFFLAHAFTAHSHEEKEAVFFVHEHSDINDFFACLLSIDLGKNHLEECDRNVQGQDASSATPALPRLMSFFSVLPFATFRSEAKESIFGQKESFFTSLHLDRNHGRAPPAV